MEKARSKVLQLETKPDRDKKEVKELLQEWLDNENIEEVLLLGKCKVDGNVKFRWDHSFLSSCFWWIGLLKHISDILSDWQKD